MMPEINVCESARLTFAECEAINAIYDQLDKGSLLSTALHKLRVLEAVALKSQVASEAEKPKGPTLQQMADAVDRSGTFYGQDLAPHKAASQVLRKLDEWLQSAHPKPDNWVSHNMRLRRHLGLPEILP